MMRILAFILFFLSVSANLNAQDMQRIVAVVNDDIITLHDFENRVRLTLMSSNMPDNPEMRRRVASQVLRKMIDENLQLQEAKKQGISITDAELSPFLENIEKSNNLPKGGLFAMLDRAGIDKSSLSDQVRADILWGRVVRRVFLPQSKVSEEEIKSTTAKISEQLGQPEVLLAEIFLAVDNPSADAEVRGMADRLAEQLKGGAPFQGLARQFSQSVTAANGGDLGWIRAGQSSPEIESAISKLNPGDLSPPIRSVSGYHIVLLRDRRQPVAASSADAELTVSQVALPLPPRADAVVIAKQSEVARAATQSLKNCDEMDALVAAGGNRKGNRVKGIKLSSLAENIRNVAKTLPINTPSPPIAAPSTVVVIMVCERLEATQPGMPTREKIVTKLEAEKLDLQARRHIRDLRRSAFVDIRI
jgi:peptidyl-prolyl cis-trans isomerase SurA